MSENPMSEDLVMKGLSALSRNGNELCDVKLV